MDLLSFELRAFPFTGTKNNNMSYCILFITRIRCFVSTICRKARRRYWGGSCLDKRVVDGAAAVKAQQQAQSQALVVDSTEQLKLVQDVRIKLQIMHPDLPVGKNGRDDDDLLLWFLKDRKFDVDAAVGKLAKALTCRRDFGVDSLTEDSIKGIAATGKAYLHTSPDIEGRQVVVVVAANHIPARDGLLASEKLCIFLIEKALTQLPPCKDKILGIFDLRGFASKNGDLRFVKFLVDVFFNYYPKRLDQVLFVEAPFIFQPGWNIVKPWLKSYAGKVLHSRGGSRRVFHSRHSPPWFQTKQNPLRVGGTVVYQRLINMV